MAAEEQKQINTEALTTATRALTKVEELEKYTVREFHSLRNSLQDHNTNMLAAVKRIQERIDKIFTMGITAGGSIIMLLIALIGYLLVNGTPWK